MGRAGAREPSGQLWQKSRHDLQIQEEEVSRPSPPPRELRPHRHPGKEPTGSSSQAPPSRQAPYMMASMPNPPSRANPSSRGIAWDICPRTPPCLQVAFPEDQRQYPTSPKVARAQIVQGFAIQMGRNYYKQVVALSNACKEKVYKYEKCEGLERALKSIFCMCKTVTQEVNENHRDIIEIKSHLRLP
ncbi:hypothetical protein C2845_PM14G07840 [Panicum miliaceum]|uniref:Uncharacterized protein n=1 Tax=Panicum miliaceum TaxID=4540 RepID=A0A3L6PQL0_PANMI|nr:hypothetical protein C2845_PM14G07840 [Panicum miliaceum]